LRAESLDVWLPGQPISPTILLKQKNPAEAWTHQGEMFKQSHDSVVAMSDWTRSAPQITQEQHIERLLFWQCNRVCGIRAYLHEHPAPNIDCQTQAGLTVYLRFDHLPNMVTLSLPDGMHPFVRDELMIHTSKARVDVNDASHLIFERSSNYYQSMLKKNCCWKALDGELHVYLERFF
jgi:hypothetical protein